MLRIMIGYDHRQPVSYNVLQNSIVRHCSEPVSITPLVLKTLPLKRQGLTPFTFSRFLVPYLCNYEGWALFLDLDMLLREDIAKLFATKDDKYAVMVSKNEHRFEWASAILFNCAHPANKILTPAYIETAKGLHGIEWCDPDLVGDLPRHWNHLVGYDAPRADASLVHYTQGIPAFAETAASEYAKDWNDEAKRMNSTMPWVSLMGNSVHAAMKDGKLVPKFTVKDETQTDLRAAS